MTILFELVALCSLLKISWVPQCIVCSRRWNLLRNSVFLASCFLFTLLRCQWNCFWTSFLTDWLNEVRDISNINCFLTFNKLRNLQYSEPVKGRVIEAEDQCVYVCVWEWGERERELLAAHWEYFFLKLTVLSLSFSFFHHHIKKNMQLCLKMHVAKWKKLV